MIKKIKNIIKNFLINRSRKINHPIIVFESDDWGSVRNSSKESIEKIKIRFNLNLDNYQSYDCLETDDDINNLLYLLKKHKNINEENPKFTLNYVMNNPIFGEINNFNIKLESVTETYDKSSRSKNVLNIIKDNVEILKPQFHAYIHFNYKKILKAISNDSVDKYSFENRCIGMNSCLYSNLDTCNNFPNDNNIQKNLALGLHQFNELFGYKSKSIIFPCYVWNRNLEIICKENHVSYLQGKNYQNIPKEKNKYKKQINIMGKKNKNGLLYLTRNVDFEPSKYYMKGIDSSRCVDKVFSEISKVIDKKIPAIICTHRVNYVSSIDIGNRDYTLNCLDELLKRLINKYPTLKFISSDELGALYERQC